MVAIVILFALLGGILLWAHVQDVVRKAQTGLYDAEDDDGGY